MSLQVNNNAVMGKEPCWGRGLIIKQLGDLFSSVHLALVALGAGWAISKTQWQCQGAQGGNSKF